MPKVSVIVPVYNAEKYLCRCIDSILSQTFTDFEVILIDDGSSDSSGEICDSYHRMDRRIKAIHTRNEGVSSARNLGLDVAQGDYITFVDSDDYVDSKYLEKLHSNGCELCICGSYKILTDGTCEIFFSLIRNIEKKTSAHLSRWFDENLLSVVWGKLFQREIIKQNHLNFYTDMVFGEDTIFVLEYLLYCKNVRFVDDLLYYYVKYESGTLSKSISEKSILSYDLMDMRIKASFDKLNISSTLFFNSDFTTKRKTKWAFFQVYENRDLSLREKREWYKQFFKLPVFYNNIDLLFADYSDMFRTVLHTRCSWVLLAYQILGGFRNRVKSSEEKSSYS